MDSTKIAAIMGDLVDQVSNVITDLQGSGQIEATDKVQYDMSYLEQLKHNLESYVHKHGSSVFQYLTSEARKADLSKIEDTNPLKPIVIALKNADNGQKMYEDIVNLLKMTCEKNSVQDKVVT